MRQTKEQMYQEHAAKEQYDECGMQLHPDGCFYCGGNHMSTDCPDSEERERFWNERE